MSKPVSYTPRGLGIWCEQIDSRGNTVVLQDAAVGIGPYLRIFCHSEYMNNAAPCLSPADARYMVESLNRWLSWVEENYKEEGK